ncbi:hypothetical protein GUITHDRAFT_101466 [Guillardia theta CCMP2712]|uniref:Uncharacterized protein n=1 Tax=Guillardia theta (strain CCMP2712) TaxID=905079 RepID=L1JXF2_GUITC|nr:hypothetical protein GUITHDRAFT_101466 [Guillardia theta CCMP2712]EKX53019.1 hypothetical protein GUITHDRAFT_101466 [Guillardia theta CCMP2712]|eukprot:XP_005839999.1 hypothetical protein GUITHDRAFT_101466 [Guillardia theta CCMP2712]
MHLTEARDCLDDASAIVYVLKPNHEEPNPSRGWQEDDFIWNTFITRENKDRVVLLLFQDASWDGKFCSQIGSIFNLVEHYTAMDRFSAVIHVNVASGEGIRESFQRAVEAVQSGPRSVRQAIVKLGTWKIIQTMPLLSSKSSISELEVPTESQRKRTTESSRSLEPQKEVKPVVDQGSASRTGWQKVRKFVQQKKYDIVELKPVVVEQASLQKLPVRSTGSSESRPGSVKSTTSEQQDSVFARSPSPALSFSSDVSVEPPHALSESVLQDIREEANKVILAQAASQEDAADGKPVKVPKLEEPRLFQGQRTPKEIFPPAKLNHVKEELMPEVVSERDKYFSLSESETSDRSREANDRNFPIRTLSASTNFQRAGSGVSDAFRILLQIFPHRSADVFELENLERRMQAIVTRYTAL